MNDYDQFDENGRKIADIYTLPRWIQFLCALFVFAFLALVQILWPNEGVFYLLGAFALICIGYRLGTGRWP